MSTSVAPLPDGVGVTGIADRRPRRDSNGQQADARKRDRNSFSADSPQHAEPTAETPPPLADEPLVPAETLFATALFANALLRVRPSANEIRLRTSHEWQPPESMLRLRDKLI